MAIDSNITGRSSSEKGDRLSVVELSNYNAPKIVESTSEDGWVTYGPNNSYFTYINECYNGSSTNRSVINSVAQQIYGKGLDFIGSDENEAALTEIQKLLKPKDLRLLAMDFKQYGQCAVQVGYSSDHTKILKVQHQPVMTLAKGKLDKLGNVNKYWYSANWENIAMYKPQPIPAFGTSKKQVEILYINNYTYSSGLMYYSNVDYQSALQYCKMEEEISNFHINNIQNGFTPSMLLTFRDGKPDVQEQLKIEAKVKQKWGGSSNAGSIMLAFVEENETAPTMESVTLSDADKQYQHVDTLAQDKILISHRVVSPLLAGVQTASGFSSNSDEMKSAYQLWNMTVINPFQEILIDGLQEILQFNGIDEDVFFVPLVPFAFLDIEVEQVENVEEIEKETGIEVKEDTTVSKKVELKKA